ncbi:MAG TPA: Ig-like domain-containing protein, partial [Gemmatimonadales bacterium]
MEPQLHRAPVAVAPILPSINALASFGLTLDRVRFIVVRSSAPPDTLVDTTANIPPDSAALDLDLHVALIASAETLQVTIVALSGSVPLFQGTAPVEVRSGGTPSAPTDIPVLTYVGPGAGVDSLAVSPTSPFIYFNDSLRFQVQAFQGGVPVTQFYVSWSTSDSALARVNAAGVLRAPTARTSVRVIARTPGGVSASVADSTTVTFLPVPSQLLIIAGGGQTAGAGQPLATQLEVEVRAADNLPVPGVDVRFRSLSGGAPADTIVTSDAQGRARVTGVLGSNVGVQTFQASLPAFPGVSFASFSATATGVVISPATSVLTVSSGSVISGTTAKLRLQTKDGAGNDVTTGGASVVFSRSGGGSTGTISAAADSGNGVYTAVFTGLLAGTATTIGATINGSPVTSPLPTIAVSPGAISPAGSVITISNDTVASGASVTLKLRGKDAAGNNVATGGDAVAFGFSGGASTGTVGATADSGNGVYTATFDGLLAGSATVITATINGGAVTTPRPSLTVIPGPPAQLAFLSTPPFATTGAVITPPVQVGARDLAGNATPSFTGNVTVAIGTNPSGGLLAGTLTQAAVAGVATFSDLAIDQPGVGYTLSATASGLSAGSTATFDLLAPGGSIYWIATGGGNWSNPANWSGGAVPGPTETAVITASGTYTVTLDVGDTIAGLQVGGSSGLQTLSASSKTLRVSGTTQVNGNGEIHLRNSTLDGGVFSSAGTLTIDGSSVINQSIVTTSASLIRIQGNNQTGHSYLTVASGFTNNGHVTLTDTVSSYGATLQLNAGTLTNGASGTIDVLPGASGTKNISAAIDNQGTFNVSFPLALNPASAAHSNSGTINITGSGTSLAVTQSGTSPSFTTTGTINIAAGDTLKVSGGVFAYGAGAIGGGGIVSLASLTASIAPVWNTGTTPLLLSSTTINGAGSITNAAGATLDLGNSVVNIPVTNQGRLLATGSSGRLSAPFTSVTGSTLEVRGNNIYGHATLVMDQSWTNNATLVLTDTVSTYGSTLTMNTATLTNAPGATITSVPGFGGSRDLNVELNNQGTINVTQTLSINRSSATHVNGGTIALSGAKLLVIQGGTTPSWTTTGGVSMAPGDSFKVSGGSFGYSGGSISGGVLSLSSVTATSTQPFTTATALLDLQNSSWNGTGTLTNAPSTLLVIGNSTIATPFVNQGTFVARGSSSRLSGSVTVASGSLMRIQGNNIYGAANLNVTSSFTNNATLELTDTVSTYGATLSMPVGATLTNAAAGTIAVVPGANGQRTLTTQLDNQGTLTI